jgi:hypothetical protein
MKHRSQNYENGGDITGDPRFPLKTQDQSVGGPEKTTSLHERGLSSHLSGNWDDNKHHNSATCHATDCLAKLSGSVF